jgi:hypothetical protein
MSEMNIMQDYIIAFIVREIFTQKLAHLNNDIPLGERYKKPYMELNMRNILYESFKCFE